jgi:hypothetical protein
MMRRERFLEFKGLMTMPNMRFNEIPYILVNDKTNGGNGYEFDLTKYLKDNQGKRIALVINKYGKDIFCEVGKVEVINEILMVDGRDVSNALWNNTNKILTIMIDTEPEKEDLEENS